MARVDVPAREAHKQLTCDKCNITRAVAMGDYPEDWSVLKRRNLVHIDLCDRCTRLLIKEHFPESAS